jgi:hypothetical protein
VDFAGGSLEGGRPIEPLRSMLFQIGTHSKVRAMTDRVRYTLDASADGFEITLRRSGLTRRLWLRARDATGLITAEMYSFPMSERKAHDHEAASAPSRTFEHFSGYFELLANAPGSPDDRILFQRGFHRPPPDQDGPSCIVSRLAVP